MGKLKTGKRLEVKDTGTTWDDNVQTPKLALFLDEIDIELTGYICNYDGNKIFFTDELWELKLNKNIYSLTLSDLPDMRINIDYSDDFGPIISYVEIIKIKKVIQVNYMLSFKEKDHRGVYHYIELAHFTSKELEKNDFKESMFEVYAGDADIEIELGKKYVNSIKPIGDLINLDIKCIEKVIKQVDSREFFKAYS
jgi:hypothetical protein